GRDLRHDGCGDALFVSARRTASTAGTRRRSRIPRSSHPATQCVVGRARGAFCRGLVRDQYPVRGGITADNRQQSVGCLAGPYRRVPRGVVCFFVVRPQTGFAAERRRCCDAANSLRYAGLLSHSFVLTELPSRQDRWVYSAPCSRAWTGTCIL